MRAKMGLTKNQIDDIMEQLMFSKPRISLVKGLNNKQTYFEGDRVFEILQKFQKK